MKRKRNMIILAVVLVVLCGVIAIENVVTQHIDSINTPDEVILTLESDSLTNVTWSYEEGTLEFENTDGTWYDSEDADFPVNQDTMAEFLAHFEEVHACFIIDDVEDYDQYGLESPQCTITLTSDEGETVVSLGNYSTMDEQRYISVGDGKVYLIEDDLLEYVSTERDDFMQHDEISAFDTLVELSIDGETTLDVVYDPDGSYSYTDSYSYYALQDGSHLALSDSLVESYLSTLTSLDLTDYATYTASAADLSEYGLDSPTFTITVSATAEAESDETSDSSDAEESDEEDSDVSTEDVEFVLYIGVVIDDTADTEEAGETSDSSDAEESDEEDSDVIAYARLGDSEIIYQLSSSEYETLAAGSYNSLRPTEVLSLDWDIVTGVSVTIDGEVYDVSVMTRGELEEAVESDTEESETEETESGETETTEEDEDEIVYVMNGQEIDFDAVMTAADALEIDTFVEEETDKTQELSMTIALDSSAYPSVEVTIYQYDGESCLVAVDGETVGLMSRSLMVDLREAVTSIVLGLE